MNIPNLQALYTKEEIDKSVELLGKKITQDYKDILEPNQFLVILCVLKGGFIFCADLVRHIKLPVRIDFISLSSYGNQTNSTGTVELRCPFKEEIKDQQVLIVEDIIDTGITMDFLKKYLATFQPREIKLASFLHKPERTKIEHKIDYLCYSVPDEFVVGYGLDYQGQYRQLDYLAKFIQ